MRAGAKGRGDWIADWQAERHHEGGRGQPVAPQDEPEDQQDEHQQHGAGERAHGDVDHAREHVAQAQGDVQEFAAIGRQGREGEPAQHHHAHERDHQGDEGSHRRAQQHVAAHEGILPAAAQEPRPGDEHVRPVPPDERLDGEVEDPHHRGHEHADAEAANDQDASRPPISATWCAPSSHPQISPVKARAARRRAPARSPRPRRRLCRASSSAVDADDEDDGDDHAAGRGLPRPQLGRSPCARAASTPTPSGRRRACLGRRRPRGAGAGRGRAASVPTQAARVSVWNGGVHRGGTGLKRAISMRACVKSGDQSTAGRGRRPRLRAGVASRRSRRDAPADRAPHPPSRRA